MAQQDRTTLKGYFNTGDTPTEQQFADLIESSPNYSEGEVVSDHDDLTNVEQAGEGVEQGHVNEELYNQIVTKVINHNPALEFDSNYIQKYDDGGSGAFVPTVGTATKQPGTITKVKLGPTYTSVDWSNFSIDSIEGTFNTSLGTDEANNIWILYTGDDVHPYNVVYSSASAPPWAPELTAFSIASDNSYIDLTFNKGVYGDVSETIAVVQASFPLIFTQGGGSATDCVISSITNNADGALSGGETIIRCQLTVTGTADGGESIDITVEENEVFADGLAATGQSTGSVNLINQALPQLNAPVLSLPVVDSDTQISVTITDTNTSPNEVNIEMQYKEQTSDTWLVHGTAAQDATAYSYDSLTAETDYDFRAIAKGDGSTSLDSDPSNTVQGTTDEAAGALFADSFLGTVIDTTTNWDIVNPDPNAVFEQNDGLSISTLAAITSFTNYLLGKTAYNQTQMSLTFNWKHTYPSNPTTQGFGLFLDIDNFITMLPISTGVNQVRLYAKKDGVVDDLTVDLPNGALVSDSNDYGIYKDGNTYYYYCNGAYFGEKTIDLGDVLKPWIHIGGAGAGYVLESSGITLEQGLTKSPIVEAEIIDGTVQVANSSKLYFDSDELLQNIGGSELTDANVANVITLKETNASGADIPFTAIISVDKKRITITPDSNFANGLVVYQSIDNVENVQGVPIPSAVSVTFTAAAANIFNDGFDAVDALDWDTLNADPLNAEVVADGKLTIAALQNNLGTSRGYGLDFKTTYSAIVVEVDCIRIAPEEDPDLPVGGLIIWDGTDWIGFTRSSPDGYLRVYSSKNSELDETIVPNIVFHNVHSKLKIDYDTGRVGSNVIFSFDGVEVYTLATTGLLQARPALLSNGAEKVGDKIEYDNFVITSGTTV